MSVANSIVTVSQTTAASVVVTSITSNSIVVAVG